MFERPGRDFVLAREPDAGLGASVGREPIEYADAVRMARDAVVQSDHHHPPTMSALFVKLIKLVFERLLVDGRVPTLEGERRDVVHVYGVGHGHEVAALQLDDERLVGARLINVVFEAEPLEDVERMWRVAHIVGVPASRALLGQNCWLEDMVFSFARATNDTAAAAAPSASTARRLSVIPGLFMKASIAPAPAAFDSS